MREALRTTVLGRVPAGRARLGGADRGAAPSDRSRTGPRPGRPFDPDAPGPPASAQPFGPAGDRGGRVGDDEPAAALVPAAAAARARARSPVAAWSSAPASGSRRPTRPPRWSSTATAQLTTLDGARDWAADRAGEPRGTRTATGSRCGSGRSPRARGRRSPSGGPFDFVFVDAEHQAEPTLAHFEAMLPHLASGAVIVFDDVGFPPADARGLEGDQAAPGCVGRGRSGLGRMVVVTVP